jgi:DNA-binding NtrC family response regulator
MSAAGSAAGGASGGGAGLCVLIVDDEDYVRASVEAALKSAGISDIATASEPIEAMEILSSRDVGLVLLDLSMPVMAGEELLMRIREEQPGAAVVVITGNRDIEKAVECMRAGAADYLVKPVERERLVATARRVIEHQELVRENEAIKERLFSDKLGAARASAFDPVATADQRMLQLMGYAEAIAKSSHPVLVTGETGVGKELFSRAVHELSGRRGELVAINAAGLDDALFADLIFGHRKGAYTGADSDLEGLIDKARDGTLFLDEIGDISQASQLKLLRVIETGEYFPLGSDLMRRGRARFIVATNRDLDAEVKSGRFRRDLYYRLRAHRIRIPPLRERLGDLPLLVERFVWAAAAELGKEPPRVPPELYPVLRGYEFPGNVRELQAIVFEAVNVAGEELSLSVFREAMGLAGATGAAAGGSEPKDGGAAGASPSFAFPNPLPSASELTELLFDEALKRADGNQSVAARLLGVSPQAVSKRLKSRKDKDEREGNEG